MLNEETLSQLDRHNEKALYNSVDNKAGIRCMSQTMTYDKPIETQQVLAQTLEPNDYGPSDFTNTTNTQTRQDFLRQKRFSSTFSTYYLNNKKAKDLMSVASIDSRTSRDGSNSRSRQAAAEKFFTQ